MERIASPWRVSVQRLERWLSHGWAAAGLVTVPVVLLVMWAAYWALNIAFLRW